MSNLKLDYARGDVLADKYEVVDHLDESPLGVTYRVKHLKSGKYVRLTLLRPSVAGPDNKDDVIRAFKAAKEIQHVNLIKVGELDDHEGVAYYTMEDFEGSTLRELIQEYKVEGKQFDLKEAAQISIQVLEALSACHDADQVLRAVRPEYILVKVRYTGPRKRNFVAQVKMIGAGFWSLLEAGTLAEDEFTRGEAQYLAPELKSFEPQATPRADGYSAAVIFYEMLTGTAPVGTFQLPTMLRPDLPKRVNDIVELALAVAPEDRYPNPRDFVTDIQRMLTDQGTVAEDDVAKPLMPLWGWALVLMGFAAMLTIGAYIFIPSNDPLEEAKAKDAALRKGVAEQHDSPSVDTIKQVMAEHPPNMIYVPAGQFLQGRLHVEFEAPNSEPLAEVVDLPAFLIDAFEAPNSPGAAPKAKVTFAEAEKSCADQGKRLCTAQEWEKACKGTKNEIYQYGDFFDPSFCGNGLDERSQAGTRLKCKSTWYSGPYDMSGNFREWTSTSPTGESDSRIVKGGDVNARNGTRCAYSRGEKTTFTDGSMSYRCCRSANAPKWVPPTEAPAEGG